MAWSDKHELMCHLLRAGQRASAWTGVEFEVSKLRNSIGEGDFAKKMTQAGVLLAAMSVLEKQAIMELQEAYEVFTKMANEGQQLVTGSDKGEDRQLCTDDAPDVSPEVLLSDGERVATPAS